jgi:hypothetical protein
VDALVVSVKKAEEAMLQIVPLLVQINAMLPEDLRLEPFTLPPLPAL